MKKILLPLMLLFAGAHLFYAQLNAYKYIVVPTKFEGFKKANQFRTSTLVKHLFSSEGYTVVYDNALPIELKLEACLGLTVELEDRSTLFATKTELVLKDCNGAVVFSGQEGTSKTKEFEPAYREAITESFAPFRGLGYAFQSKKETSGPITISFKNDVRSLEDTGTSGTDSTSAMSASDESQKIGRAPGTVNDLLYAQPIDGGYQLVDATPKVVYVLKSTSSADVFLATKEGENGVVYKNDGKWFMEMDKKGAKPKELNIKF